MQMKTKRGTQVESFVTSCKRRTTAKLETEAPYESVDGISYLCTIYPISQVSLELCCRRAKAKSNQKRN